MNLFALCHALHARSYCEQPEAAKYLVRMRATSPICANVIARGALCRRNSTVPDFELSNVKSGAFSQKQTALEIKR